MLHAAHFMQMLSVRNTGFVEWLGEGSLAWLGGRQEKENLFSETGVVSYKLTLSYRLTVKSRFEFKTAHGRVPCEAHGI